MGRPKSCSTRSPRAAIGLLALVVASGCNGRDELRATRADDRPSSLGASTAPQRVAATTGARRRVVVLGDSLTAGLGVAVDEAYPAMLQRRIDAEGLSYEIVNAGVSGDTSAGGLSRLDWSLDGKVRVLVVALGGNDGLRGLPPQELAENLSRIIERAQARGVRVVLAGMEAPPNFGPEYTRAFHAVYPAVAKRYRVALVPFLLAGVAGRDEMNQRDRIHPNPQGARLVADNVWAVLGPILKESSARD
jgi:acyl-CoA thioesterase-1